MSISSRTSRCVLVLVFATLARGAFAQPLVPEAADPRLAALPPVIGELQSEMVDDPEDTVLDVAHRNRLGFDRVARLNPGINVWIPDPGSVIRLPT